MRLYSQLSQLTLPQPLFTLGSSIIVKNENGNILPWPTPGVVDDFVQVHCRPNSRLSLLAELTYNSGCSCSC